MSTRARSPLVTRAAVPFAGGVLGALSLPPWGWWPLAVVGLAMFAWSLSWESSASRALSGAAFGAGLFSIGLFWVTEFHAVGYVVLTALETSFFVAGAVLTRRIASFPATVVLAEAARGAVPFGGLPLGGLALGQADGPFVANARTGGALLVLGVVAALSAAIVAIARSEPRARGVAVPLVAGAVVLTAVGWLAPAGEPSSTIDAVLVQGGGRRGFRAVESDPIDVLDAHLEASADIDPGTDDDPLDLVLWPENAIDVVDIESSVAGDALAAIADNLDTTVIAGVAQDVGDDGFENVAVVWNADGEIVDRYTKVRRVPFGEYVPMRGFIERLADLSVLPRDAVAGIGSGTVDSPAGRFAVSISYEVFFADRARSGIREGGEVLLVPTNAASFTTSQVPTQEVAAAQLRAWETGRWVLQAAPTGYSAVIDERGRVLQRSVLGEQELLAATVTKRTGDTLYTRAGDLPVLAVALLLLVAQRLRGWR
jgi:apolipoprotein N-acyltransferase